MRKTTENESVKMGIQASKSVKRRKRASKGIFCLEGDWWGSILRESSVRPALELLRQWDPYYIPFIHRDVATRAEFDHYIKKWTQASAARYPILYLPFHSLPGALFIGDQRRAENRMTIDEIELALEGKCHRRIVHLGGCGMIDIHGRRLNRFLDRTGALAVCGYRNEIDWLCSTAFEIMVFGSMQLHGFTISGAKAISRRTGKDAGLLARQLGFRMVIHQ